MKMLPIATEPSFPASPPNTSKVIVGGSGVYSKLPNESRVEAKVTILRSVMKEPCIRYESDLSKTDTLTEMNTADYQDDVIKEFSALRVNVELRGQGPYAVGKLSEMWNAESFGKAVCVKTSRKAKKSLDLTFISRTVTWSHLKHENVLNLLGVDVLNSSLGLVSPKMKNGNILSYLEKHPLHDRLKSITEISAGLNYLHSLNPPIIHGNIKGSNVIVCDDLRCCLADLSVTTTTNTTTSTYSSPILSGSVRWLAPEAIRPTPPPPLGNAITNDDDTPRDIFSYALTIVEMMTGQNPFSELVHEPAVAVAIARGRRPPRPAHPKEGWCPDYVWELVERCWDQDPGRRPRAGEVYGYLRGLVEGGDGGVPFLNSKLEREVGVVGRSFGRVGGGGVGRGLVGLSRRYLPHEVYSHLFKLAKRETLHFHEDDFPRLSETTQLLSYPEENLRRGVVYGIIQSHRYRERLYEVLHAAPTMNASQVYQAVLRDEERVAELVEIVLRSKHCMADVLMLDEGDMECFMDALQDILDNPESALVDRLREKIRILLITLSKKSTGLPKEMFIDGVVMPSRDTVWGGAFGDVFRSSYEGRYVALKRLRFFRGSGQGKMCKKFCKEARTWKRLNHKYVLPLLGIDADTFPRQPCMVSPWMFNGTINEFLKRKGRNGDVLRLLFEVIQGIEYLHSQGVVHGDIKGANILIDDEFHPRLIDFGLTIFHGSEHHTTDLGGTLRWMAPELFFGNDTRRSFASDVYAFGCLCVEVYTGKPPFANEVPHDLHVLTKVCSGERPKRPSLLGTGMPDSLWALVGRCWNQKVELRPSCVEISREMERIVVDNRRSEGM
ncbi:kinase-like protein [Marasmius fiardii PR-910]|nr:kinase-like protein [Marasmius fiardii PR-910]